MKRKKEGEGDDKDYAYPVDNTPVSKSAKKMEARRTNELIETAINALNRPKQAVANTAETEVRSANKIFGVMVWRMWEEIPDGYAKDMVKIDIIGHLMLRHRKTWSLHSVELFTSRREFVVYIPYSFEKYLSKRSKFLLL